jgi:hypothetical protein
MYTKRTRTERGDTKVPGNEPEFVRCKWCGTINQIGATTTGAGARARGDGWGGNISYEDISGVCLKNPVVNGGCWFCGSSTFY